MDQLRSVVNRTCLTIYVCWYLIEYSRSPFHRKMAVSPTGRPYREAQPQAEPSMTKFQAEPTFAEAGGEEMTLSKLEWLSQMLDNEAARIESLTRTVKELEHEIEDDDSLKTLQTQVDELSAEWREVMDKGNAGTLLGQYGLVAIFVEQAICSHVLPEVFVADVGASLHELLTFLNDSDVEILPLDPSEYDREKVLHDARERWVVVCENFNFPDEWKTRTGGWSIYDVTVPGDIVAIELLKESGLFMPYPSCISLKYAKENVEFIKGEMPAWQFDLVAAFIGSLRDKMTKSGLHHKDLLN